MPELTNIRVGICCCTPLYHGQLNGRKFLINGQWFQIREVKISERQHTKHIRANRCHFFIDINTYTRHPKYRIIGTEIWAWLYRYDFFPPIKRGRREQLKITDQPISTENWCRDDPQTNTSIITSGRPNNSITVLRKIRAAVEKLRSQRNAWLRRVA